MEFCSLKIGYLATARRALSLANIPPIAPAERAIQLLQVAAHLADQSMNYCCYMQMTGEDWPSLAKLAVVQRSKYPYLIFLGL